MASSEFPADGPILSQEYIALVHGVNQFFIDEGNNNLATQVIKVFEEAGEIAKAFIGHIGANPRKGLYANRHDIADELADVAISAFVGMLLCGEDPNLTMARQARKTIGRIEEFYSSRLDFIGE
jgi:NTP pyrophosphatase (non-canonical NTP hydrolase)